MILAAPVAGTIRPDARYYPSAPGAFLRPAGDHSPLVTQDFGPTSVDVEPTVIWPGGEANIYGTTIPAGTYANFHNALDLSTADCLRAVLAAGPGKVTKAGKNASGAIVVEIDHGSGFATGYVHLAVASVAVGSLVSVGQAVGKIGDTGMSTACHLHFYAVKDGKRVDPWRRLSQNTSVDPDQEADVPVIATYVPGHIAVIANATGNANVRAEPKLAAPNIRQIPVGQSESWTVTGWVKGDTSGGSDQWITRWAGSGWEYVHKVNVQSVTPVAADCGPLVKAAKDAGYAAAKTAAGLAVAAI